MRLQKNKNEKRKIKPKGRMLNKFLSMLLLASLVFTGISIPENIFASADVTNIIKTQIIAKNDGNTLVDDLQVDATKTIDMDIQMQIPVKSDNPTPVPYVQKGDTARIELGEGLLLTNGDSKDLNITDEGKPQTKLGEYRFVSDTGKIYLEIEFNGDDDIFENWDTVSARFGANFKLDLSSLPPNEGGTTSVTILEKTFSLEVKKPKNALTLTKKGKIIATDSDERAVEWTVTAESASGVLDTYIFEDDLTNVGEYIPNSLKIKYTPKGGGTEKTIPIVETTTPAFPYDTTSKLLSYTFDKDGSNHITSPATITFKTKMTDAQFMAFISKPGKYEYKPTVIKNTALLKYGASDTEPAAKASDSVTWDPQWAMKGLVKTGNTTKYHIQGQYCFITWRIVLNETARASLKNVVIKDIFSWDIKDTLGEKLPRELQYDSAVLRKYPANDDNTPSSTDPIAPTTIGGAGNNEYTFNVGDIEGKVELDLKLKVDCGTHDEAVKFAQIKQSFTNKAEITWDGNAGIKVLASGSGSVGKAEIEKSPDNKYANINLYGSHRHYNNFDTTWKIVVSEDHVKSTTKVYDMFIFDKSITIANYDTKLKADGALKLEDGSDSIDGIKLNDLLPNRSGFKSHKYVQFEQKNANNLSDESKKLYSEGKYVGDLVIVSGFGSTVAANRTFYLKSYLTATDSIINDITDPQRAEGDAVWTNTTYLAKDGPRIAQTTSWPKYMVRMLKKEALTRDAATAFRADKSAANANGQAVDKTTEDSAFNYVDKTATYRISVNANKVHDLGDLVVTDTLPKDWELVSYSIFEGESKEKDEVALITTEANYKEKMDAGVEAKGSAVLEGTADGEKSGVVKVEYENASGTVKFTFPNIDKAYVIMLEAKATEKAFKKYVEQGKNTVENSAKLEFLGKSMTRTQNIKIAPKITFKDRERPIPAEVLWKVDYVPHNLVNGTKAEIEDILKNNIEIRQGAVKNSILVQNEDGSKNFQIFSLQLNEDGSVTEGAALSDEDVEKFISYDSDTRTLKFQIPNGDVQNAYRFSYITDLTGGTGTKIENVATLKTTSVTQALEPKAEYTIVSEDASAMAKKSAFVEITKTDKSGNPLKGAKFTLVNKANAADIKTATTNVKGIALFKPIPAGEYTLKETEAPGGYKLDEKEYTVKVEKNGLITKATILGKVGGDPSRIVIENEPVSTGGGSGGGGSKPKPPKPEPPKTPETPPTTVTPETPPAVVTPETPVVPTPSTPEVPGGEVEYPKYPRTEIPDPKDPDSPSIITLIDENGVPLGNYKKQARPDGTMEYVLIDEDVPLANILPKTGESSYLLYLYFMTGISMIILGIVMFVLSNIRREKRATGNWNK